MQTELDQFRQDVIDAWSSLDPIDDVFEMEPRPSSHQLGVMCGFVDDPASDASMNWGIDMKEWRINGPEKMPELVRIRREDAMIGLRLKIEEQSIG